MPTEQERRGLRHAIELGGQLQAQWREDLERDPRPIYADLLTRAKVPIKHLLYRKESGCSDFILILDKPDEAAITSAFTAEVGVTQRCMGQDISFKVQQTYSGTEKDVEELIGAQKYAVVQLTDQGKPESKVEE